jgi:hypothetical protein
MPRPSSHTKDPETWCPLQPAWTARQFHLLTSLNGIFWEHAQPCCIKEVTATFVATPEFSETVLSEMRISLNGLSIIQKPFIFT